MMYIYGLYARGGHLRYVGRTNNPNSRLKAHWRERKFNTRKAKWLRTLPGPPELRILAIVEDGEVLATEYLAIESARRMFGRRITNSQIGWKHSKTADEIAEVCAKMSLARRKLWAEGHGDMSGLVAAARDPEHIAMLAAKTRQRWKNDPGFRERIQAGREAYWEEYWRQRGGKPPPASKQGSPEFSMKMTQVGIARWQDPAHIARQQAAKPMSERAREGWAKPGSKERASSRATAQHAKKPCPRCGGSRLELNPDCCLCVRRDRERQARETTIAKTAT